MSTFLFLFLLFLLAWLYYYRIYDRWWLGAIALLLVLTKLGYSLNALLLGLYYGAAKVLKTSSIPKSSPSNKMSNPPEQGEINHVPDPIENHQGSL